jgi:hypothetical protein
MSIRGGSARRAIPVAVALVASWAVGQQAAYAAPSGWLNLDGSERYAGGAGAYDWANSGAIAPVPACPAGAVNVTGSGGLFNCGSPGAGSAPPGAPALTAAAAADPSIISATFISDAISSDTTPCGGGDPTTFPGGLKNGDDMSTAGAFTYVTGSNPPKDDLANVFAVTHTVAATGRPEVYFGAERLVNNGASHIDFEFLQSGLTLTGTCSGSIIGHRTEGDLLVAVDFTVGGSLAATTVWQWHCVAEPGPQPADGTVCDPVGATAAAHYQQASGAALASLAFTVNAAAIPCGGWVCRDQSTGNSTQIAANDLLEGGINLSELPFTGCFSTFLPHTRTAPSFTASLADFAGPVALQSCRNPAMASTSTPSGTGSAGVAPHDTVGVGNGGAGFTPTGSVTFFLCGPGTGGGCPSGGAQIGAAKPLIAGSATSDAAPAVSSPGTYCWRAEYAPDAASQGVFQPASHTNASTECFSIAVPGFPNTGRAAAAVDPTTGGYRLAGAALLLLVALLLGRRSRRRA